MSFGELAPKQRYKVHNISAKPGSKSKELLERVAKQVQPVMRKHSWDVPLLSELTARNGRLWGLNIGGGGGSTREIKLRLRRDGSEAFIDYDFIVGTMLHELCHNVHGLHDAKFYGLLDTITEELEEFMATGITGTGEGFDAPSKGRLGGAGFGGHNPDVSQLRSKMVQAAEARAKRTSLMPGGPRRLGGKGHALTLQQAVAAAAERRAQDDMGCGCGAKASTDLTAADVTALEDGASLPQSSAANAVLMAAPSSSMQHRPASGRVVDRSRPGLDRPARATPSAAGQGPASAAVSMSMHPQSHAQCSQGQRVEQSSSGSAAGRGSCGKKHELLEDLVDLTGYSDDEAVQEIE